MKHLQLDSNTNFSITSTLLEFFTDEKTVTNSSDSESKTVGTIAVHLKKRKIIRKSDKDSWKDCKRKSLRNLGLEYSSRKGKIMPSKKLLPGCDFKCRLQCQNKIKETARKELFQKFWSLGDRVKQWKLITNLCERIRKRRITTEHKSSRQFTIRYFLYNCLEKQEMQDKTRVCKTMFLNTFDISESTVNTALNKLSEGNGVIVTRDNRGRHGNHHRVIDDEMIRSVCDHVNSFARVKPHDSKENLAKTYLDGRLTITKMFQLYTDWVQLSNYDNKAMTIRHYTDIVNKFFDIEFCRLKKTNRKRRQSQ
ncbi:unnamed protein product [Chilo suppressalis]|uniref:Uncharacterized protein n=1 Tax=Chilo suppressalis TaxID=168631 RepID=A0ABN8L5V7_CHISP|nr:unnamed protein product [Chilo suppressalis]